MYSWLQRRLTKLTYLLIIVGIVSFLRKDRLPDYTDIHESLREQPKQRSISKPHFKIDYKERSYEVRPRASYELTGLIVSQNNPSGIADIYHDSSSLDTKDFCIIWGHNVRSNEFKQVTYWSGSWTCYCKWDAPGLRFWIEEFSNNHLITDSDIIRKQIANAGIGDQVRLKGMLVDYKEIGSSDQWRNSSLVRTDSGNGACEVFFVEELQVLRSTNETWRNTFTLSLIGIATLVSTKFLLFLGFAPKTVN